MGSGVVKNLCKNNFTVYVFDIDQEKINTSMNWGAIPAKDYTSVAQKSDAVLLFLPMAPFDPTLEEVVLGKGELLAFMRPNSVLVDCGNTSPILAQKLSIEANKKGVLFLDAPVSGGSQGAESGTLSIMVGGSQEGYNLMLPVFKAIGKEINYFGPPGMGQVAKLANNMLVATSLAALSEVLVFATKLGIEPSKLLQTLSNGAASSWVLKIYGNGIINRPFKGSRTPGGGFSGKKEGGRDKQLFWALSIADELDIPLPITTTAYNMFMMARGMGKSGLFEPIVEMLEDVAKTIVIAEKVNR
jgi:3-hydroxyisobutyrate dehydrogenase-like beta-hydroxyacid dehydrogenase